MEKPSKMPTQGAVIELRKALGGISQQDLAVRMKKALVTVARWETSRPPSGMALIELQTVALKCGRFDLVYEFKKALNEELPFGGGIPLTDEERMYHDAILDLLRNRHIKAADSACRRILRDLTSGHAAFVESVKAGERVLGANLQEIEATQAELEHEVGHVAGPSRGKARRAAKTPVEK